MISTRVGAVFYEYYPLFDPNRKIEPEQIGRGSCFRGQGQDYTVFDAKVAIPRIVARVEKTNHFQRLRIARILIRPFERIALRAAPSQILHPTFATVLAGEDVIQLMGESHVLFMNEAVFTTTTGAL